MKVSCIVVNFRTAEHTVAAVDSVIRDTHGTQTRVTIVDNDSRDGSLEAFERAAAAGDWNGRVHVIASTRNGGFGYGNNLAIRHALAGPEAPDFFFLLNPDAVVEAGATRALLDAFGKNPLLGIAGSKIRGFDDQAHVSGFRFPTILGELEAGLRLGIVTRLLRKWAVAAVPPDITGPVDWVSGAAIMVRRHVFESVGLFDESFFLFYEETDLCHRARRAGWDTWYVHESRVRHAGAVATGLREKGRRVPPYWYASRRHYYLKHHGRTYLWCANSSFAFGYSLWRVRRRLQKKPDADPPHLLADFLRYNLLPARRAGAR
jgi:hypothetical protein